MLENLKEELRMEGGRKFTFEIHFAQQTLMMSGGLRVYVSELSGFFSECVCPS